MKKHNDEGTAFVALLRACTKNKDLCRGTRVHNDILKRGLLAQCLDALVTMYAKCGALGKAKKLLHMYKSRDVFSWTALIAGYAQKGQGQEALTCFERMQHECISPDAVTFACALKACGNMRSADKGEHIHDEIARQGLLGKNIVLGTALVDMYAKCGALMKAQQVLQGLPVQNVASWNALIAGYAQQGEAEQALKSFERMQQDGISPNAVTFACILKACGSIEAIDKGEQIHDEITRQGLLGNDVVLGNALVDMYARWGALEKAQRVLEELPKRDVVSWSALIQGYAQHGQGEKALNCFERMQCEGLSPNAVTFVSALKACGSIGAVNEGENIHDEIARQGLLGNNIVLGTALVDMYGKCGALAKAQRVLEELPVQNVVSWSALIAGYTQEGQAEQAVNCFEQMQFKGLSPDAVTFLSILKACGKIGAVHKGEEIHDEIARQGLLGNDIALGNALVDMYAKCGALVKAQRTLEELPVRNVVSWSSLISGYAQQGQGEQALNCFERMQGEGLSPNAVTFLGILKACGSIGASDKGEHIHDEIARQGLLGSNIVLDTALVDMYAKCGALAKARQLIEELRVRDVVSWSALITGYAQQGQAEQSLYCVEQMQSEGLSPDAVTFLCILKACGSIGAADKGEQFYSEIARQGLLGNDIVLGNALVDMYAKCGAHAKAQGVLEELPVQDVVSWNALIAGYAQQGQAEQALNCFEQMQREGVSPDAVTFLCTLKACGSIGAADKGEQIHDEIARQGLLGDDIALGNALVDMYAKCGALSKARRVLEELPIRNVVSWNALITGYAQGQAKEALKFFDWMQHEGLSPDSVTFLCILKACGSIGLVDDARMHFVSMSTKYGIEPDIEHYTCMIDVFGRAGHLDKAVGIIQKMPLFYHSAALWSALLGACWKWGDVNVGRWAFEHAVQVDESGPYL